MNKTQSCLSHDILEQIARDEILPDELRCIEDHVSECEHCRDLFVATTAENEWTEAILPVLRERRDSMPNFVEMDGPCDTDSVLRLLGPTDDPRMLGRIGAYEVMGVIGRGGMGIVFKAFDAPLNRFVAIKMLLPHLASSGAARQRFSREGQAAAAVIDDHVLPIFGVDEWQGMPYLVTQYSSGMSLQKRIQDRAPLELKEVLRISVQTARGLAAAHSQGLVHRDVKPSNILLDGTVERALLTDFGLARAVDDASITRSGTIAGTPQFMAPEQARGEPVDQRSDLFSLGSVIYAMCAGHPPFRADSSYGVLRRIIDEEPRPIREINPDIPEWLCGVVARLMAKEPEDRFESAGAVATLLEECLAHVQQPTSERLPDGISPQPKANERRAASPRKAILAGLVVIFGLALAGILAQLAKEPGNNNDAKSPDSAGAGDQIGTVVGKPVFESDRNKNVDLREDLVRLFVRPVEEKYLNEQQLDPEMDLKKRIPNDGVRAGALMFVRQRVLHDHLYRKHGGRVLLSAFGPFAYDAHRKWLAEREKAGDFRVTRDDYRELLFAKLDETSLRTLTEDPETIRQAFDPAATEEFIKRIAATPENAGRDPKLKLIGVVHGVPIYLHDEMLRDAGELPEIMHGLIVPRLEEDYRKQHPEVVPSNDEINKLAAQLEQNHASRLAAYAKSLADIESKLQQAAVDSAEHKSLASQKRILETKINPDHRQIAEFLAGPKKFQQHLFDHYDGGRVLQTPQGPVAFDAQRKWVEQRQALGDFQIVDPALLRALYDHWDTRPQRTPAGYLIDDLEEAKAVFGGKPVASVETISKELADLTAVVRYDFGKSGLSPNRFAVQATDAKKNIVAKPDGVHVTHPGRAGFSNSSLQVQLRVYGDFEITATFQNLSIDPGNDGTAGLSLTAIIDNTEYTHGTVYRGALMEPGNSVRHITQSEFLRNPDNERTVTWRGTTDEKATSGRIRLSRVGETLYCLFAPNDSPQFRLIHAENVGKESLLVGGVRLNAAVQSNGSKPGTTSVLWKDITIRAERITDWAD